MNPTWQSDCGSVKLWLGDCLDVMRTWPDGAVDAVVTDPPYGIGITKAGAEGTPNGRVKVDRFCKPGTAKIKGDDKPDSRWLFAFKSPVLYSWSRWDVDPFWHLAIERAGYTIKNRIVWVKSNTGSGDLSGAFAPNHETLFRAGMGRLAIRGYRWPDVWRDSFNECVRHGKQHPFEKPVDLLERAISSDTDEGNTIADPFMGSGTTGVAAVRIGRQFWGVEIDPQYFEIAKRRIQDELRKVEFLEPERKHKQRTLIEDGDDN